LNVRSNKRADEKHGGVEKTKKRNPSFKEGKERPRAMFKPPRGEKMEWADKEKA